MPAAPCDDWDVTASRARCASEPVVDERYVDELRAVGEAAGLSRLGVASAEPFADARRQIEARKAAGLAAEMQFTFRNPARSTEPERALPSARALVVGARAYGSDVGAPPHGPHGRVARYAVDDHYAALRAGLDAVAARLRADGWRTRTLADDNALVDRAAAHRAAIGWFGKNANILLPGEGSWFVLGSVLTDAPLPAAAMPVADGCGACTRCIDGCPTGAIVAPGVVDARRCLAWLLQAEGDFPEAHRVALGDRMRGSGPRWEAVHQLFEIHCRRLGLNEEEVPAEARDASLRESQGELF